MLDRGAEIAEGARAAGAEGGGGARRRRRGLALFAVLALALHWAFLDRIGSGAPAAPEPAATAMAVRAIPARIDSEAAIEASPAPVVPIVQAKPTPSRRPRESARTAPPVMHEASTGSAAIEVPVDLLIRKKEVSEGLAAEPTAASAAAASTPFDPAERFASTEPGAPGFVLPMLPGAGEQPPPVYRTRLPPAATLHYHVLRGFLSGEGEIRWRPGGDGYRLVLEARIAGLTLLEQTSEGAIDGDGIAPVRFVDRRARRSAQAANFVRDAGKITFSGSGAQWPLLPGSQDRLSWMIQLAGIAAADPGLLADGGRISMAVAGARGDASVWTLRYAGREDVETARGAVRAVKLVRDGRSAYDTSAEIWLDPERSYFPARATLRNSSGAPEYDLLLDRIDP